MSTAGEMRVKQNMGALPVSDTALIYKGVGAYLFGRTSAILSVDKSVSGDLEISTSNFSLMDVAWPAPYLRIVWEDKALPECLALKAIVDSAPGAVFLFGTNDKCMYSIAISAQNWEEWQEGEYRLDGHPLEPLIDKEASEGESAAGKYVAGIVLKVLGFASTVYHVKERAISREERKNAMLHPRHDQRHIPAFIIRHLPRVVAEKTEHPLNEGCTHLFLGRRGHLRTYRNERYKNVRGTIQWIPPIPPPHGVKVIYRVHRVRQDQPISP